MVARALKWGVIEYRSGSPLSPLPPPGGSACVYVADVFITQKAKSPLTEGTFTFSDASKELD